MNELLGFSSPEKKGPQTQQIPDSNRLSGASGKNLIS